MKRAQFQHSRLSSVGREIPTFISVRQLPDKFVPVPTCPVSALIRRKPVSWGQSRSIRSRTLIFYATGYTIQLMSKSHPSGNWLAVFVTTLLLALTVQSSVVAQQPRKESEVADVYEAVVRYQIKSWDLAANSYCVSIEGRDAAKDFLKRFDPLPVKGASSCRKQTMEKVLVVVTDKQSGKRSVIQIGRASCRERV